MEELAHEWLRLDKDETTRSEIQQLLESHDAVRLENRLSKSGCFDRKLIYVTPCFRSPCRRVYFSPQNLVLP